VVGLKNPHVPLVTTQRFGELYKDVVWRWPESFRAPLETLPPWVRGDADGPPVIRGKALRRCYEDVAQDEPSLAAGDGRPLREFIRRYLCNASAADDAIGRVVAAVDGGAASQATVVILTSDNGFALGQRGLLGKHTGYEASLRVPLIIRTPQPPTQRERTELVLNTDLFPTILDWAGLPTPTDRPGRSLRPLVEGRGGPWRVDWLIVGQAQPSATELQAEFLGVRGQRWKYVRYLPRAVFEELFDLENDPHEMQNLAGDPAAAEQLARARERTRELMELEGIPCSWFVAVEPVIQPNADAGD
jgi:arylsulfatase A-like enzyme